RSPSLECRDEAARAVSALRHQVFGAHTANAAQHGIDQRIVDRAIDQDDRIIGLPRGERKELPVADMTGKVDAGDALLMTDGGEPTLADALEPLAHDPPAMGEFAHHAPEIVPHFSENSRNLRLAAIGKSEAQIALRPSRDAEPRPDRAADPAAERRGEVDRQ